MRDAELNEVVIEEAIQKEKEAEEEQQMKAKVKRVKKDLVQQAKELYNDSEERDLTTQPEKVKRVAHDKDPFFRIPIDNVNHLLTEDKTKAIKTYHTWERPTHISMANKKEFLKNAFYVSDEAKNMQQLKRDKKLAKTEAKKNRRGSNRRLDEDSETTLNVQESSTVPVPIGQQSEKSSDSKNSKQKKKASEVLPPIIEKGSDKEDEKEEALQTKLIQQPLRQREQTADYMSMSKDHSDMNDDEDDTDRANDQQNMYGVNHSQFKDSEFKGYELAKNKDKHLLKYPLQDWQLTSGPKKKTKDTSKDDGHNNVLPLDVYRHRKDQLLKIVKDQNDFTNKMDHI